MKKSILMLGAVLALGVTANAQKMERKGKISADKIIERFDENGDNQLSKAELGDNERLTENFDKIDTNSDSYLSEEELNVMIAERPKMNGDRKKLVKMKASATEKRAKIAELDTDSDKLISKAEAAENTKLSENFDTLDTDKDGFLSKSELKAAKKLLKK